MATLRMKEGPVGTRIRWKLPTQQRLATATAETILARKEPLPPSNTVIRRALKDVQGITLESDLQRDIPAMTRMPWLRPMVLAEIDRLLATPPPAEPRHVLEMTLPVSVNVDPLPTRTHPDVITANDYDLVLDTLTSIEEKLSDFRATQQKHEDMLTNLIETVKMLGTEVNGLGQIVIKKRERAAQKQAEKERLRAASPIQPFLTPPAPAAPKPVRIAVVGLEIGNQRRQVEDAVAGFTANLELQFHTDTRSPHQIPRFDQLIILERSVRTEWQRKADHLYPGRIHHTRGLKGTVDLIQKFGQYPERYRAE